LYDAPTLHLSYLENEKKPIFKESVMKTKTPSLSRPVTELDYCTFIKMPAGYVSPTRTHTEDYWAVVVSDVTVNKKPDSADVPLPVGSARWASIDRRGVCSGRKSSSGNRVFARDQRMVRSTDRPRKEGTLYDAQ
jgi:hypothetical protein